MKALRIGAVIFGAVILTSLAIDASDTLSGKGGTMLAGIVGGNKEVCPVGMVNVPAALTFSCVDKFEVNADTTCPVVLPQSSLDTEVNIARADCKIENTGKAEPWRFINREQAAVMCARAGKRLPTAGEWYQFSLGTPKELCNVESGQMSLGDTYNKCLSAVGARNSVGNVWEWVSDDVIDGVYQGRSLPETGYVEQVDAGGVATVTTEERLSDVKNEDYFWSSPSGAYGIIRGGFYGSRNDAGVFTLHAQTLPTFTGAAIGFRCVR